MGVNEANSPETTSQAKSETISYVSKPSKPQSGENTTFARTNIKTRPETKANKPYTAKLFGALNRFAKNLHHDVQNPLKSKFGNAYDLLIRADAYRYQQNLDQAIPLYEEALELNPRFGEAALALAECFNAQGQTDKAIQYYKHHINHMPFDKVAQRQLGRCYNQNQNFKKAKHHLNRAWQLEPTDLETRFYLALACEDLGENDVAVEHYQGILGEDPNFVPAAINLGNVLFRTGDLSQAETAFRDLVKQVPRLTRGHLGLALTLDRLGEGAEALQSYHRVLASAKNNQQVLRQDKTFIQNRIADLTQQWNQERGRRKGSHLALIK